MPIDINKDNKGWYVRWGKRKKYYFDINSHRSFIIALGKAEKQKRAIYSRGWRNKTAHVDR